MLPQPLIEQFWQQVDRILEAEYCLTGEQSKLAVSKYRQEIEPKAGQMVYHQDATEVALSIANAVKKSNLLEGQPW